MCTVFGIRNQFVTVSSISSDADVSQMQGVFWKISPSSPAEAALFVFPSAPSLGSHGSAGGAEGSGAARSAVAGGVLG